MEGKLMFLGRRSVRLAACAAILLASPLTAGGQEVPHSESVFSMLEFVDDELELIRREMGKPVAEPSKISVTNAAPREVFFQALTLYRKADRLCFEIARERGTPPEDPTGEIDATDVLDVIEAALGRIQRVKEVLGITEQSELRPPDRDKTPTDAFRAIVQTNRQLNLLLEQRFAPSDVYQQVTLAIGYAARLLSRFDEAERIPETPPLERGLTPADSYQKLLDCFDLVREISLDSGLSVLQLEAPEVQDANIDSSDAYDIAALLVSELRYLHAQLPEAQPPRSAYYPGRKFPSHVHQRAELLEVQLQTLHDRVRAEPRWLVTTRPS